MWLSRNDNALFPIALPAGRHDSLRTWAVRFSLIVMALAIVIAAFAQNNILEG
jgi:hypothetical protein